MSVILMTTLFYKALILQGEIWCWSLLGLKGHLKSEFALSFKLYCVYFTSFNPTKVGDFFWRWILKDCIDRSSGREKENRCLVFKSSTKREIRHFQVVVVQRRQRNVRTSVMHMQSCCFAYLNLFWSFPFSLPSPSFGALLKLPKQSGHRNRIVWKSLSRRAITNPDKNMRFQKCLDSCARHGLSVLLMFFGEF